MSKYVCNECGYVYSAENHEPDYAEVQNICLDEGAAVCPMCGCSAYAPDHTGISQGQGRN